ncbi:uncharacterized protein K04H4.2 isoform X2 [Drosophila simulans]|uniref:uncharacterized protein K04H4.2 isoform X2 n=1 Tax=Drosophila simulans TaxID=7240 RepID=UPI001D110401|nr:uncharacterized protein K04H4.2 isoform X2 [Drosophila simulans]
MLRLLVFLAIGVLGCQVLCNSSCSTKSRVSCLSQTEFQFCSSASMPRGKVYSCPKNHYCTGESIVCSKNASLAACNGCNECTSDNQLATRTSITEYCRTLRRSGRFPHVQDSSVSIKHFYGNVYSCPGSTIFDSTTEMCTIQTDVQAR